MPPVLSVHFEWLLDTVHGADYFRRWHRQKANSGGLMVHKSGHHFDLVYWWLNAQPVTVGAMGRLGFYGVENGRGHQLYRFDRSLMERLSDDSMKMSMLQVQRRMRPEISRLIR